MTVRAPARTAWQGLRLSGWWLDVAMLVGFAVIAASLAAEPVRDLDLAVRNLADANRPPSADLVAQIVNRLGSGGVLVVLALVTSLGVAWRRRSAWPVAIVVAAFVVTAIVIAPFKLVFHRAAPHSPLPDDVEVRLYSQPGGLSFPSGHAVNSVVWYGVICLLLAAWLTSAPWLWARWLPPVVVGFTATYLGYHWLTDLLAGLCLGVLIDRAIARVPWPATTARRGEPRCSPRGTQR